MSTRRGWLVDGIVGLLIGGVIGAIVAVNVIITAGIEYHVTLAEVLRRNLFVGMVVTAILVGTPLAGVGMMRRIRRGRRVRPG